MYRFVTEANNAGTPVTTLLKVIRGNREDRIAKLEWSSNGILGRAVIGKTIVPMTDLVRHDPQSSQSRMFNGPDGLTYRWISNQNGQDIILLDPRGEMIAKVRSTKPVNYPGLGNVYCELHLYRNAGAGVVMHPPLVDTVMITAMLYRHVTTYNL